MKEEIFIPLKKEGNTYYGKCLTNKNIQYITNISNLQLNKKHYVFGEEINENYIKVSQIYKYIEIIGTITNLKAYKNKRNIATIKTEDGLTFNADVNSLYTELNEIHMFKGYFENKSILKTIFAKKLTEIQVEIKEDLKIIAHNYKNFLQSEILDSYSLGAKKEKIYIIGNFSKIYKNDILKVYGYKDGNKFYVLSYEKDINSNLKMTEIYLKQTFKGIIKAPLIKKLINKYGLNVIDYIENKPEEILTDFKTIDENLYFKLYNRLIATKSMQEFFYFCEKKGISADIANYIFNLYGGGALDKLKKNPYIITEARLNLFEEADIIAKEFNFQEDNLERIKASIKYFISEESISKGDIFVFYDDLLNNINPFIEKYGIYENSFISSDIIKEAIKELTEEEILKIDKDRIYYLYNYIYERESARLFKNLLTDFKPPFCKKQDIFTAIDNFNINYTKLDSKQESAIKTALTNNVSILTGGPGTGKTLTVNAILKSILYINPNAKIKLCAPTGRASKRMTEVTNYPATTIHKLLGLQAFDTLTKNSEIPTDMQNLDFLIIDEFSMVDIKLFYEILICLDERTRLILIGDSNQLPSVGAGQVLKDLISSKLVSTTQLTEIFRQAGKSNIIQISHKIIKKENIDINNYKINDIKNILTQDVSFIPTKSLQDTNSKLYEVIDLLKENSYNFENVQILAPMNRGDLGTNIINNEIQKSYNHTTKEKDIYTINSMLSINKNDKVIQTVNNYNLSVMNGSIGYVKNIYYMEDDISHKLKDDEIIIEFDDKEITYNPKDLIDLKLAYNITIHKSQGSEFPIIILPLDIIQKKMLNLNLLYTAITRAKIKLIIIGNESAFQYALKNVERNRNSNFEEYLKNL